MKRKVLLLTGLAALLVVAATVFAGCSKVKKYIYPVPENIAYDGSYLTWDKCEDAKHYTVSINGGEAARTNSATYAYATTERFDVTVTAVYEETEQSTSATFNPLAKIETVYVANDGVISWDAVSGATAYALTVNGQAAQTTETAYELPAGSNRVKVKPIVAEDNTFYSWWSTEQSVYIYSVPTTVKYDGTDITWTGNAAEYEVTVNGQTSAVTGNKMAFKSENRDFTVEVKALGNHTTTYDSKVVAEEFHYLDPVSALFVEDGIIKWNAISGAEGYKIKIGGVVQKAPVTGTEYAALATGKSQDIAVMPYNDSGNYFSSWSATKTVYILDTPAVSWNNDLELDGEANNNFIWDAVNASAGYSVRLTKDGKLVGLFNDYSATRRFFANAYADVGVYTVEVKANAESGSTNYYDSKYSAPITVERLAAPNAVGNNFIVSKEDNLSQGFTVNFVPVNGASGYQMYKDGVLLNGKYTTAAALTDTNVSDPTNMSEQHYTYKIRSMGGVKTADGKKYVTLPCLTASALSFDITVQATPQNPRMSDFALSWDAVAGNSGYCVAYAGTTVTAQGETLDLSTMKAGTYALTVCARGNGGATLASNFSSPVNVQRLEAPTEIKITSAKDGTLECKEVANADGYLVYLDLSSDFLEGKTFNNMYQFIETNGTTLSMTAKANHYNHDGTLYYMTSEASPTQQFIRLAAPTFPEGALANSIELLWNTPANINTAEYTPTYKVYSAINEPISDGVQNATKFNIKYLEGGAHRFLIKAIGNGTKYLDSEYSVDIVVHKLATPQFTIENGQYVWNGVDDASGYYLTIDGRKVSDEFYVSGSKYSYTPRYTEAGDHIVKLQAVGDAQSNGRYVNSAEYTYTQKVQVLATPQISYAYSHAAVTDGGSITVTITKASPYCAVYQYEIAGKTVTSAELMYTKVIQNTGKFAIRVKALGGSFDKNNVYYMDSQYAGGSASDTITLLGNPSQSSVVITSDGVIKWNNVDGNYGYEYEISYDSGEWSQTESTGYATIKVGSDYKKYRTISIRVRAKGSADGKTITSEWTEWTWTNSNS